MLWHTRGLDIVQRHILSEHSDILSTPNKKQEVATAPIRKLLE